MHFLGVARLLEERGGIPVLLSSAALKAQMAMLVWYDISIALLNKKGCCIPIQYLAALAVCKDRHWTFFSMTGCYNELLLIAHQLCTIVAVPELAKLARDSQRFTQLEQLEQRIHQFGCDPFVDSHCSFEDTHDIDKMHDKMHGANLWRYTLLLYSARTLRRLPGLDLRVQSLARRVLENARAIPMTHNGPSKQHLLPILLAASEERNQEMRAFAIDYMTYWGSELRFPVWEDALDLLKNIWQAQLQNPTRDINLVDFCAGEDYMFG